MKLFDFSEFLEHFRNLHLHNDNYDDSGAATEIKTDIDNRETQIKYETLEVQPLYPNTDDEEFMDVKKSNFEEEIPNSNSNEPSNDWLNESPTDSEYEINGDEDEDDTEDDDSDYQPKVLIKHGSKTKNETPQKTYNCPECEKIYKTEKSLKKHLSDFHNKTDELNYKCSKCDLAFAKMRVLQEHLQKVHGGYPCPECDNVYKSNDALRVHRYKHSGQRNFVCDIDDCGKTFYNPKNLCAHKRLVHLAGRNLVCEICGHRTKVKSALELHKRSHTGEKPFICKICGKAFRSSSLLKEHQPMHSTERPHVCDVCGATFSRPKALYHHKHLHLAVKKYVCKLCGKAYAQAAGLCGHMRQHKAEQF